MKLILPKAQTVTRNTELVEADNIRRSIERMRKRNYSQTTSAKRAIVQAMLMAGGFSSEEVTGVRNALHVA